MPFKVFLVIMVLWKGEKIVKKRGIFFRILVLSILSVIVLAGCQQNPEEGPRKVAQTYFDAVKMGDVEKAFSCYAPEVQQELDMGMDIASGISESASEKLFGFSVDATGIGSSFMGFAAAEAYENYEFKATDVNFTDEGKTKATVTVEVYIDDTLDRTTEVSTVKYQDEWYLSVDEGLGDNAENSEEATERKAAFWKSFEGEGTGNLYLADARSFSEGVAWVTVSDGEDFQSMLIDDEGNSLYQRELTKSMPSVMTNFSNDVGFIQDANGSAVVDTKGNIIFTDEDIFERCVEIFGEDSLDSFELLYSSNEDVQLFNGYCKVELDVNTYEGSGYYQGILKPDGSWLLEPEEVESGVELYADWPLAVMVDKEGNERAIKLETGEIYDAGPAPHAASLTHVLSFDFSQRQFNQESFASIDEYGNDMTHRVPLIRWMAESVQENTDGLIYDNGMNAFVDKDWNKVIDLSEYTFPDDFMPVFTDGYAFLLVKNPDGDLYYTVIDKDGTRVFEPKKWDGNTRVYARVTGDRFLVSYWIAPQLYPFAFSVDTAYRDLSTGEPIEGMAYEKMYPYADDLALVVDESGYYEYIDLDGNVAF